ncbi:uridine kinase [Bogoriella caseilytica]|uniref:Uridine kinase n=2 Tax=Bogoriella caseilytica TaxID=56055 RepID=A0A3N2BBZ2_9MICO|nr:uridine kinase [Bogoriella caseilytica]
MSSERAVRTMLPHLLDPGAIVLVDGRSGSGKTTLARRLIGAAREAGAAPRLVALDAMYQGWDGLWAAAQAAAQDLVRPLSRGEAGHWQEYDWNLGRVIARHTVLPGPPLLVEGVGALTPLSAAAATYRVWLTAESGLRRERALTRDGETFRPHWDRWAAQEAEHLRRHQPERLADLVIDTSGLRGQ